MKRAIICFTRIPMPGETKTRLMPVLRGEDCAALHKAFLQDIAGVCAQVDADLYIAHTQGKDWETLREIFPQAKGFFPQEGRDLGERMHRALREVLQKGYDACVLTGSDLPLMGLEHLESGFQALERADVALGPTSDGGYYLVGVKRPCATLFEKQTYGFGSVFESTVRAAENAGLTVAEALPCDDVDTPEDLNMLRWKLCGAESHTGRCLASILNEERQR